MVKKMLVTATFREFDYDFVFSNTEQEGEIPDGHIQDFIFDETSGNNEVIYFVCDEGGLCDFSKPYSDLDKVVEELKW